MSYQIGFNGAASAELSQLLRAVERQLNGSGMHLMAQANAQAQPASSASTSPPCPDGQTTCAPPADGGYGAGAVAGAAVVGLVVGVVIGRKIGQDKKPGDDRKIGQD